MFSGSAPQVIRGRKTGVPFPENLTDDANGIVSPNSFRAAMAATRAQHENKLKSNLAQKRYKFERDEFWNDEAESFLYQINRSSISPLSQSLLENEDAKDDSFLFEDSFFLSAPRRLSHSSVNTRVSIATSPTPFSQLINSEIPNTGGTPSKVSVSEKYVQTPSRDEWDNAAVLENASRPSSLYNRLLAAGSSSEDDFCLIPSSTGSVPNKDSLRRHSLASSRRRTALMESNDLAAGQAYNPDEVQNSKIEAHDRRISRKSIADLLPDNKILDELQIAPSELINAEEIKMNIFDSSESTSRKINDEIQGNQEDLAGVLKNLRLTQENLQISPKQAPPTDEIIVKSRRISERGNYSTGLTMDFESSAPQNPILFSRREVTVLPVLSNGERMPSSIGHGSVHIRQTKSNHKIRTPLTFAPFIKRPLEDELLAPIPESKKSSSLIKSPNNSRFNEKVDSLTSPTPALQKQLTPPALGSPLLIGELNSSEFLLPEPTESEQQYEEEHEFNSPTPPRIRSREKNKLIEPSIDKYSSIETQERQDKVSPPAVVPPEIRPSLFPPDFGEEIGSVPINDFESRDDDDNMYPNSYQNEKYILQAKQENTKLLNEIEIPKKTTTTYFAKPRKRKELNVLKTYARKAQQRKKKPPIVSNSTKTHKKKTVQLKLDLPQIKTPLTPSKQTGRPTILNSKLTSTPGVTEIYPERSNDSDPTERTKRVRVAPIEYWRGEAIKYKQYRMPGGSVGKFVDKIVRVDKQINDKIVINQRKAKPKAKKMTVKSSNMQELHQDKEQLSEEFCGMDISLFCVSQQSIINRIDPHIKVFQQNSDSPNRNIGRFKAFFTAGMENMKKVDPLDYKFQSMLEYNGLIKAGVIELPAGGIKPNRSSGQSCFMFVVQSGKVETSIHSSKMTLIRGEFFCVPPMNQYTIRNLGSKMARVYFFAMTVPEVS